MRITVECLDCLWQETVTAEVSQAEAEYQAGVMVEKLIDECGHDIDDVAVQFDDLEITASTLECFRGNSPQAQGPGQGGG